MNLSTQKLFFDRDSLKLKSLSERKHDLDLSCILKLKTSKISFKDKGIAAVAKEIITAKKRGSAVILMIGGHVLRSGVQNYLIDLIRRNYISCIASNGAGIIHDFEFALIGATTENVAKYIREGKFGLWRETAILNDIINRAYERKRNIGLGEAVGNYIENSHLPYKEISVLAAAYRHKVPFTVHVGIGYDIIHEYPNCNGAATGALSYNDFLKFACIVQQLEGGVIMNFGSSVMAPEVFLKALSMARNIAHQKNAQIRQFTTLVCDLVELPKNFKKEAPRHKSGYYFRPWKTMLIRTVADGGKSFYVKANHVQSIPALWARLNQHEKRSEKGN